MFSELIPYAATGIAVLAGLLVLFAGNQVYRAVTLKKAPDYDVESYFWSPASSGKGKESVEKFSSIFDEPSVTVSVVVPAYNEEERIVPMMKEMLAFLEKKEKETENKKGNDRFTWEILVVDDGSKDKTASFVNKTYVAKYGSEKFRVLRLFRNNGKGGAVRKGAVRARGRYILMADADGATQASDLATLMSELQKIEKVPAGAPKGSMGPLGIAVGSRAHLEAAAEEAGGAVAKRSPLRKFLMWGFHTFIEVMIGSSEIKDTQCGFKLFTRETARLLFPVQHIDRWAFDVELLFLAARHKVPMVEVPVTWNEIEGSKLDVLSSTVQMARDIFAIRACYSSGLWSDKHVESTPEETGKKPAEHVTPQ